MANPWLRLYSEWSHDPKVQMMSEAMQRRFIMLLCERCECVTLDETERAFHWRISETDLAETKAVFLQKGFIDEQWNLVNWNKRQFLSDSSTKRVRLHRAKKKQSETLQQRRRDVTVTPPDADADASADAEGVARTSAPPNAERIPDSPPEGLSEIEYGKGFCEALNIPTRRGYDGASELAGVTVAMLSRDEGCSMGEACRRLIERARGHPAPGGKWRFWLQDGAWRQAVEQGVSTEGWDD